MYIYTCIALLILYMPIVAYNYIAYNTYIVYTYIVYNYTIYTYMLLRTTFFYWLVQQRDKCPYPEQGTE